MAGAPPSSRNTSSRAAAARALIDRGDANSLATAAALSFAGHGTSRSAAAEAAVELASKADQLAPDDAVIGWLRLQICAAIPGCDIRDPATTMRWVDADNAAVWTATLAVAHSEKNAAEVTRVLQAMAQGKRFDVYRNRTVVLLFDALKKAADGLPVGYAPSDSSRLSEAIAIAGSEIFPAFSPLLAACREPAGVERRRNCLKLSKVMQRGDSVSAQMAGFAIETRLCSPNSKEARALAERRRTLQWRVSSASAYAAPAPSSLDNVFARERVRAMRAEPREEDVDIAILRKHKIAIEPPETAP